MTIQTYLDKLWLGCIERAKDEVNMEQDSFIDSIPADNLKIIQR